jgi:UDP-N-acetylmuramate dehydrogenase
MPTPVAVLNHYNLQPFNTFGIRAYARQIAFVSSVSELDYLRELGLFELEGPLVLGGGSNMLLMNDLDRLVIVNRLKGRTIITQDSETITVRWAAGESWHQVVMEAIAHGWGGIENLALIPGCIGAAPIQNIGAYGVELKDVFVQAEAYDLRTGEVCTYNLVDCQFGYRESIFKQALKGKVLITSVTLRLSKPGFHQLKLGYGAIQETLETNGVIVSGQVPSINDVARAVISIRQSKLPDPAVVGNAGSFFKNPEIPQSQFDVLSQAYPTMPHYPAPHGLVKVPAGWLIEQAGMKGYKAGSCGVHDKQALVLVNYGPATGAELIALAELVISNVESKFGIKLTPEVNWIS